VIGDARRQDGHARELCADPGFEYITNRNIFGDLTVRPILVLLFCLLASACQSAPAVRAAAAESPPAPQAEPPGIRVDIPMDLSSGRPVIDAVIHGQSVRAIFDTGSQGATIPRSLAEALKLPVIGRALVGSPNGGQPVEADVVSIDGLEIDGLRLQAGDRRLDAVVLDDAKLPPGRGLVIGNNQFPGMTIELDFPAGRFRLSEKNADSAVGWAPLSERGLIETQLRIGEETMPIHIDTGNAGVLDLPQRSAARLPLSSAPREGKAIHFVDSSVKTTIADMRTDALLGDLPVKLDGAFRFAPVRFANLGGRGLKGARLRIDMTRKLWHLSYAQHDVPVIGEPSS